jgi:hypothetical protein
MSEGDDAEDDAGDAPMAASPGPCFAVAPTTVVVDFIGRCIQQKRELRAALLQP